MGTHDVKIVVIYPRPQDEEAFEKAYKNEHMPMAEAKLKGMTRFVATKVVHSPQGKVTAYRIAEVHFSNIDDLNKCLESDGGKEVVAHAAKISTGGPPLLLVCEEESFVYW
ncbi:MAG TPA: EthD family reductase [Bryobacteraceae bacterium]|nr:EthD family reductase [Bryobacteraceae bacterium]